MSGHTNSPTSSRSRLHPRNLTGKLRRTTKEPIALGEFSDVYTAEHNLGGSFIPSAVSHGLTDLADLPKTLAVKAFRGCHSRDQECIDSFTSILERSLDRWVNFAHENIAECYGYALDYGLLPALIMRYYSKGNITHYVTRQNPSFNDRIQLVLDIARGLEYLHTQQQPVVHGDLRAANIFVNDQNRAVIADFELQQIIDFRNFTSYKSAGPVRWTAPELFTDDGGEEDRSHPIPSADAFAFAMTIIEIYTGDVPFASIKRSQVMLRMISEGRRPDIPQEIKDHQWFSDLLQQCWDQDPAVRPTASQVVYRLRMNRSESSRWSYFWSYLQVQRITEMMRRIIDALLH